MKKLKMLLCGVLLVFFNCSSDDDANNNGPIEPETTLIERFIGSLNETSGQKKFKVSTALLSNANFENLDITQSANIQDDEFKISVNDNNQMSLTWNPDHQLNYSAQSLENLNQDMVFSPVTFLLSKTATNELTGSSMSIELKMVLDENLGLKMDILKSEQAAHLKLDLIEKSTSDYVTFSQIGTPTELFTIESESLPLDLKYSLSQNSLYYFNRKNQFEQQFGKYDLNTNTLTVKLYDGLVNYDKQIEFVNGEILGITSYEFATIDYDLIDEPELTNCNNSLESWYTLASYNNDVYSIGGYGPYEADVISKYNESTNNFDPFTTMSHRTARADGLIYDNKFYVFGGTYIDQSGQLFTYDRINIYNMPDGNILGEWQMTEEVIQTYVARKENLIVVAGRAVDEIIENNNGNTILTKPHLGVFNTVDNSYLEIDISQYFDTSYKMSGMTISHDKIYFVFFIPSQPGLKVYEADLVP